MDDGIDQAVLFQELGGLETLRQILVRGFLDDARAGKSNHALRLRDDDIA